jgi:hypothetical protein
VQSTAITSFTLLFSTLAAPMWAQQTYTAPSCSRADVQAAINQHLSNPADGDIISIPAGTCTWTGATALKGNFTHSVTIQGAGAISSTSGGASTTGTDQTVIIDNISHGGGSVPTMELSTVSGKTLRVTGIAVLMNASSSATNNGVVQFGGAFTVRMDHCHIYTNGGSTGVTFYGFIIGVLDHNYFDAASGAVTNDIAYHNASTWNGTGDYGDASWADTEHWGTNQFLFLEDSRFYNGVVSDGHEGARYVMRYNTVTAATNDRPNEGQVVNHGLTSGRGRSVRAAEVYHNNFVQPGTIGANHPTYSVNGGSLLYWGNTITQYRSAVQIDYTRKDNSTYPYGSTPNGWGNCTGSSGTAWDGPGGSPCIDGPARGAGDRLSGYFPNVVNTRTGNIAWPQQQLSPIYAWGNSFTPAGGFSAGVLVGVNTSMVSANREYYQQFGTYAEPGSFNGTQGVGQGLLSARPSTCTPGPGGNTPGVGYWTTDQNRLYVCTATNTWTAYYTPYTYPHPLTQGGTGPASPTNLVTTVH